MKKSNINLLLVALSSAAVLAACNSGSSPSPSPTPTPTPTPTPVPTPTPTPTPTPVPGENMVSTFATTAPATAYLSGAASTGTWAQYRSGVTTVDGVAESIAVSQASTTIAFGQAGNTSWNPVTLATLATRAGATTANTPTGFVGFGGNAAAGNAIIATNAGSSYVIPVIMGNIGATALGFVSIANGASTIISSPTWTAWNGTAGTAPTTAQVQNIVYAGSQYVLTTTTGGIWYSTNGSAWAQVSNSAGTGAASYNSGAAVLDVKFVNGYYFANVNGALYSGPSLSTLLPTHNATTQVAIAPNTNSQSLAVVGSTLYVVTSGNAVTGYQASAVASGTGFYNIASVASVTNATGIAPTRIVAAGSSLYGFVSAAGGATTVEAIPTTTGAPAATVVNMSTAPAAYTILGTQGSGLLLGIASNGVLTSYVASVESALVSGNATYGAIAGVAGSTAANSFMGVTTGGATVSGNATGFTTLTTLFDTKVTGNTTNPARVTVAAGGNQFVFGNNTYVVVANAGAAGNTIFVSTNNGTSWTQVTAASLGTGNITAVYFSNGKFWFNAANGWYSTATPLTTATWQQVAQPVSQPGIGSVYQFESTTYMFSTGSTSVSTWNGTSWTTTANALPTNFNTNNVAYNGSTFAEVSATNVLYTSSSLTGTWTPATVTFANYISSANAPTAFAGTNLVWDGLVWVSTVANNNVYYSTAGTSWTPASYTAFGATSTSAVSATGNLVVMP
ncbi:beta strand repeat-containing protein [Aquella oligotrophica]|nr:hypothetical protein [Aquella oligotrophica]